MKRRYARRGFKIGDIEIPPERADVTGFINDLPHYMSLDDITTMLRQYGEVIAAAFKTHEGTGVRCGGLKFELNLHAGKKLPQCFIIMNDTFTIETRDDLQRCSFCDSYGHVHRFCRKKQERFEMAQAEDQGYDGMELDVQQDEEHTQPDEEQQQQPCSSTISTISRDLHNL